MLKQSFQFTNTVSIWDYNAFSFSESLSHPFGVPLSVLYSVFQFWTLNSTEAGCAVLQQLVIQGDEALGALELL